MLLTSGVTRGLSQEEDFAEGGPTANNKKNVENDSESRCACLY